MNIHYAQRLWIGAFAVVLFGCELTDQPLMSLLRTGDGAQEAAPAAMMAAAPAAEDPASEVATAAAAGPLIVIRFDDPDTDFDDAVGDAISAALVSSPLGIFDVLALAPDAAPLETKLAMIRRARDSGERVLRSLAAHGVPASQLELSARTDASVSAPRVLVYVR
jgi:hypothetical protein